MHGFPRSLTFAVFVAASAFPEAGNAQETTESESYGERYDSIETYEYGEGTTAYIASARFEVNGEEIYLPVPELFSYARSFTPEEVAAQLPESYVNLIDGVGVTITAWAQPELTDSYFDVTDTFFYQSYNSYIDTESSVQFTSGDFPGAEVPIGYRGGCSDGGVSGSTNFDALDGRFANCEFAEDYITVAPGTINRHTHTTSVYVDEVYTFESSDYALMDFYLIRPASSSSWSAGNLNRTLEVAQTNRVNSYSTGLTGMFGEETLFDVTIEEQLGSEAAQALLAELSRPTGRGANGAAAIISWTSPQFVSSNEELLSTSNSVYSVINDYTLVSVTVLQGTGAGETVLIGNRGACSTTGVSGVITGANAGGEMAMCEGGAEYRLSIGEVNTNTHTTSIIEQTITTTTTENWQVRSNYMLTANATLIGQIHASVVDTLFGDNRVFSTLHREAVSSAQGTGPSLWARAAHNEFRRGERDGNRASGKIERS